MKLPSAFLTRIAAAGNPFARCLTSTHGALKAASVTSASVTTSTRVLGSSSSSPSSGAAPTAGVFGVGVDIAHIPRFAGVYRRHGLHFLRKCLHPSEIVHMERLASTQPDAAAAFLASRWAAKEALTKACGRRLLFPEMCIQRDTQDGAADPRAHIVLSGEALEWSREAKVQPAPLLALSHDAEYAVAFVCIQHDT